MSQKVLNELISIECSRVNRGNKYFYYSHILVIDHTLT